MKASVVHASRAVLVDAMNEMIVGLTERAKLIDGIELS